MNLVILENSEKTGGNLYKLTGRKKDHLQSILEATPGRTLKAGIPNESSGNAVVTETGMDYILLEYRPVKNLTIPSTYAGIQLFAAFQRPQTVKKLLHLAGCTGISLAFYISDKSQKSYLTSPVWNHENIKNEVTGGMEQCMNLHYPEISIIKHFPDFSGFTSKVLLDTEGDFASGRIAGESSVKTAIVLGPEGGLHHNEKLRLLNDGFKPVKLSNLMLRTEFALAYLLECLERERREN